MKKALLLFVLLSLGMATIGQKHNIKNTKAPMDKVQLELAPKPTSTAYTFSQPETISGDIKGRSIDFIPIGQAGNAYGLYSNSRTYLWADPALNSIVFTHRMVGGTEVDGNSRLSYDVSTDGGSTWETNVKVYQPTEPGPTYPYAAGRYPQGLIVNPEGNTDPANAFYSYLAASIINTNGIWGGYVFGSNPLTETNPPNPTQTLLESEDDYWRLIPDAMTVTQSGTVWYTEPSTDYTSGSSEYTGEIIIGRGEIVDGEIAYEESLYEFLAPLDAFNDSKVAFAPDGLTGYMVFMTGADSEPVPYTNYHPVLLKTIDGGESWSDPIHVQFGGVDGIESLKYYWSDEVLESIDTYGPGFNRDEVYYNMGYSVDVVVCDEGNPHLVGIIAIATDEGNWYPGEGTMATWHVYSKDGGDNWDATALYDNIFLEGDIGGLGMWNRPYASSTYDGHLLFFSWIDTDLDGAEGNTNPNIFMVGYDDAHHSYTEVENVTELSLYWFSAFYGSASQYVFSDLVSGMYECEIPFIFTEYTVPGDPASEMNFYYVDGYTMDMPVGVDNVEGVIDFSVAQNSPNPAFNNTSVLVTSETPGVINLRISNILGQVVHTQSVNNSALAHTFNFDVSNFDSGIYFYTIEIGNKAVTKKMLVK